MALSLLLIDNYDSFTYNLYQTFLKAGVRVDVVRNDQACLKNDLSCAYNGIVISPGPGTPRQAGLSKHIIQAYTRRLPVLGVCLGMQCINEVQGGKTVKAAVPVHGKTSAVYHDGSDLYQGIPSPFEAARYHSLVIDEIKGLAITSHTKDNIPMSVSLPGEKVWGIQYHPESFLTPAGPAILANFLKLCGPGT